ncbi:MAG: cohesin domain-containing protein [Candidatus Bathyarchaeia archaeon]
MKIASARIICGLMIVTALLGFAGVFRADVAKAAAGPLLFVDPQSSIFSSTPVGTTFLVNVSIANITLLAGIQFTLTWNHNLLKCNSMTEVFFSDTLITAPDDNPSNINVIKRTFNNTAGTATYGVTWVDNGLAQADGYDPANVTTTGSAVGIPGYSWPQGEHGVATLNFTVLQAPNSTVPVLNSALSISNDVLGDYNGLPITHTNVNGLYQNTFPVPPLALPYFSMTTQGPGASGTNYTAASVGETFNVTVSINNVSDTLKAVGYEFKLGYNGTLLQVLSVTYEGPWLPPFGVSPNQGTLFTQAFGFNATINENYTQIGDAVLPDANGTWHAPFPSGSGVLAIINFNCTLQDKSPAPDLTCPLTLFDTIVTNTSAGVIQQSQAPVSGTYIMKSFLKSIPGDLNHDGIVDIKDAIAFANAFGSHRANYDYQGEPASPNWNPEADLKGDGTINILDLILLAANFGRTA